MSSFDDRKDVEGLDDFWKTLMLHELGKAARAAYSQGVSLEEVHAICGAAYGDWCEPKEDELSFDQSRPSSTFQHREGYRPEIFDEYW